MKPNRRSTTRPYVRRRSIVQDACHGAAARLRDIAGRATRPDVEPLEPRQLLFALTIDPSSVDPTTGIGFAGAVFGYTIPYLFAQEDVGDEEDELVEENFDDAGAIGAPILSQRVFEDSQLLVRHNITPTSDFRLALPFGFDPQDDAREVEVLMQAGEFFSFSVLDDPDRRDILRGIRSFSIDFIASPGSTQGLDLQNTRVTLLLRGQVVAQFEGRDQLANFRTGGGGPQDGIGTFVFSAPPLPGQPSPVFDTIRFESIGGPSDRFRFDNISFLQPPGNFAGLIESRIFGAWVTLAGTAGTTVNFFDLYGRPMVQTIQLGRLPNGTLTIVDSDDDGVPNFNDGIGRIVFTNADSATTLTMFGGEITADNNPDDADFIEGTFAFNVIADFTDLADEFEGAGFGFRRTPGTDREVDGLNEVAGSVIIGSPIFRDNTSTLTYQPGGVVAPTSFISPDQGIFALGSQNVGSINIHGLIFGNSVFNGAVDQLSFGSLYGSVTVKGDLGRLVVGSDAGLWVADETNATTKTGGQLIVERTLGQVHVGGRTLMDVTVVGELTSSALRPPRDIIRYFEIESPQRIDAAQEPITVTRSILQNGTFGSSVAAGSDIISLFTTPRAHAFFGSEQFINGSIGSAEFVGNAGSQVQIIGDLGFGDPLAGTEDHVDVFAVPVDGTRPLIIEAVADDPSFEIRLVDVRGRQVAAAAANEMFVNTGRYFFEYLPEYAGVYYLVLTTVATGATTSGAFYTVNVSGMAPVTMGMYRSASGMGLPAGAVATGVSPSSTSLSVNVLSGSVGMIASGTQLMGGGGAEVSADGNSNFTDENTPWPDPVDRRADLAGGSYTIAGSLFQIYAGSDIETEQGSPIVFQIGGNLGYLITGQSEVIGTGPTEGDIYARSSITFNVGRGIGFVDVSGAVGFDQDDSTAIPPSSARGSITFRSGTAGGRGDIGVIRMGSHAASDAINVITSPGSTVGLFAVSQEVGNDGGQIVGIDALTPTSGQGVNFNLGAGSDLRFLDTPNVTNILGVDTGIQLILGRAIELVDDGGGRFTVSINGLGAAGSVVGLLRFIGVDRSQGVALATIEADLSGARTLSIRGLQGSGDDVISIGRIDIQGADAQSRVEISGNVQIDVWQIVQTGGAGFNVIENLTPGGDIVAIDVAGINTVRIAGDLGRTQLPNIGPKRISPFIGINGETVQGIGRAGIQLLPELFDTDWNGAVYRPVGDNNFDTGNAYLSDIGSPVDGYLDGLLVRGGNLTQLRVGGAVGDVILGPAGIILDMTVNAAVGPATGGNEGIFGNIYAGTINNIDIGGGLEAPTMNSLSTTGIFANDDIVNLIARNATISGLVIASNVLPGVGLNPFNGIDRITLTNSRIVDAFVGATNADEFWVSVNYGDDLVRRGEIRQITGDANSNVFRTKIVAQLARQLQFAGDLDAVQMIFERQVENLLARNVINSTGAGTPRELFRSFIIVGANLQTARIGQGATATANGVFADTLLQVGGEIETSFTARLVQRSDIQVAGTIRLLTAQNIRSTRFDTGQITSLTVSQAIRASEINVSGPIISLTAEQITATNISITGPDGRLDQLTVATLFDGAILSTGPVTRVQATAGDLRGSIETRTPRGNVANLVAGRDFLMSTDISGTLSNITVGRNLGDINNPSVVLVRGNLSGVNIANGGLYSDLRVANNITGAIVIGAMPGLPNNNRIPTGSIEAFGRIESVVVNGDYAGNIVSYAGGIANVTINNGSLLPSGSVAAFNGDLISLVINAGHLLGNVHSDRTIFNITVNASEDGVFGDIGVNPALSGFVAATSLRNQLPPGVGFTSGFDGPRITALEDIGTINVTGGSIFEALIHARHAIGQIDVNGDIRNDPSTAGLGTQILAGNSIFRVSATGSVSNALIAAGVYELGSDGRAGGVGDAADLVKSGFVETVEITGDATNVAVAAGIVAGADGVYNTADDMIALGISYIGRVNVGGTVTNVSAHSDSNIPILSPGITTGGQSSLEMGLVGITNPATDAPIGVGEIAIVRPGVLSDLGEEIASGGSLQFTRGVATGTISFSGPGNAFWNAATGRLLLVNTTIASSIVVTSDTGALQDFDIITNDDASLGRLEVQAVLFGDSDIFVDGYAEQVLLGGFRGTGSIIIGNDVQLLRSGSILTTGRIHATFIREFIVNGDLGGENPQSPGTFTRPTITMFESGGINVSGSMRASIRAEDGFRGAVFVNGAVQASTISSGNDIASVSAASMTGTVVAAANNIGTVNVSGNVASTMIMAGADLGRDAAFGGAGVNRDTTNGGNITTVTVGGNFESSSVSAGLLRGADGFLGTSDDVVSGGRSNIGTVTIGGQRVGSNRGSESYGVFATGTIGSVRVAGQTTTQRDNFAVRSLATVPDVFSVRDLEVGFEGGVYIARITFNQAMNAQTLRDGLIISEVRQGGLVKIRLDQGNDYLFDYDAQNNAAVITFFSSVTRSELPQLPGVPGPGLYRFELDPNIVRAQNSVARMDADGDGFAETDRFYAADAFVGDVGDKVTPGTTIIDRGILGPGRVDFYGPGNLDTALDSKFTPDALPDVNKVFTLRGYIGDHPDADSQGFSLASDTDVYTITLQAGQILRLGPNTGSAFNVSPVLLAPNGQPQLGITPFTTTLPAEVTQLLEGITNFGNAYLVTQTGTYFLVFTNGNTADIFNTAAVANVPPAAGLIGGYSVTIEVFDDGDSGFSASTNSGNGRNLVEAPFAAAFAGSDGQLGTSDDRQSVTVGAFTFTRDAQTGIITGTDGRGVVSTRLADGRSVTEVRSAIGPEGSRGRPGTIAADVDVYHLNNRQVIQAGDQLRMTVKLSETGADLGGRQSVGTLETILTDFSGAVQFGLFNTTNSTGINDGQLVFSPTEFATIAASGAQILAQDDLLTYGTDENGDFFVVAQVPTTGTYAFYIQGVFNADYVVEIERQSLAPTVDAFRGPDGIFGTFDDPARITRGRFNYTLNVGDDGIPGTSDDRVQGQIITSAQNVFVEFSGGSSDWLEVGNVRTNLLPFTSRALGFTGTIDGLPVDNFVQREVINNLNTIFQNAGYDVNFSSNASDFQGQDFSTVFITDTSDPINFTFSADPVAFFFNPFDIGVGDFSLAFEQIFGYSQRSDPFNADKNDEAVVFVPQLTALGYNPSDAQVRNLTDALAAAVSRRVGELLGLRTTFTQFPGTAIDVFSANSPSNLPTGGGDYIIPAFARPLSSRFDALDDTQYFLGVQNSRSLLDSILSRI